VQQVSGPFLSEVEIEHLPDEPIWTGGLIVFRDVQNYTFIVFDGRDVLHLYEKREGQLHLIARGCLEDIRFLRLEHTEEHLRAYVRTPEGPWYTCGELPEKDDGPLEVGILAYGSIKGFRTAGCRYRNFRIWRPGTEEGTRNSNLETHGKHPSSSEEEAKWMEEAPMTASLSEQHVRTLYEVGRLLNSTLEFDRVLDLVMEHALKISGAERGAVVLREGDGDRLRVVTSRDADEDTLQHATQISESIVEDASRRGEPVLSLDAQTDPRFRDQQSVVLNQIRSVLCLPLTVRERIIGTVYLDHRGMSQLFSPDHLPFFRALAEQIALALDHARMHDALWAENIHLREEAQRRYSFPNIIGESEPMQRVFRLVDRMSRSSVPVMLVGETGTGKELIARAIHYNGDRKDAPFVPENCAALPENLLESELFGHARGAFTGAIRDKKGLFEVADGGTLFLDEIADASPSIQAKLLRVLEQGEIRRVGENEPRTVDVRILSATSRDLQVEADADRFRRELYYRLDVVQIELPPLRTRREDIPLLVRHFLRTHGNEEEDGPLHIAPGALDLLIAYGWPGNVRELENELRRALALAPGGADGEDNPVIRAEMLSEKIRGQAHPTGPTRTREGPLREVLAEVEREMIRDALAASGGNKTRAADRLGLTRKGLRDKMARLGL